MERELFFVFIQNKYYFCFMNKIKEEILEIFEDAEFLPGEDDKLVGYAEMFGFDCIPLYEGINYISCGSPDETMSKMAHVNTGARFATGFDKTLIGHLKLENGKIIYLHEKEQIINQLIKEYSEDKTGLFDGEEDCYTSAVEMYEYNIIGAYTDGIPAFAVLYSK